MAHQIDLTLAGEITLDIPQVREGGIYPLAQKNNRKQDKADYNDYINQTTTPGQHLPNFSLTTTFCHWDAGSPGYFLLHFCNP